MVYFTVNYWKFKTNLIQEPFHGMKFQFGRMNWWSTPEDPRRGKIIAAQGQVASYLSKTYAVPLEGQVASYLSKTYAVPFEGQVASYLSKT